MEAWASDALGPPGGETDARLLELCRTYPHSWLPNVLGKRSVRGAQSGRGAGRSGSGWRKGG